MKIISLFFPSFISVFIRHIRKNASWEMPVCLFEYGIYVLINTWITTSIVTYIFGIEEAMSTSLESFSFFTKYTVIAIIMAIFIPYVEEIINKYISVRFTVNEEE